MEWYQSKITCEITITNQDGPGNALDMIQRLLKVPAIDEIDIQKIQTNYSVHNPPLTEFVEWRQK
jgi:hypothetical protein